MENERGRKRCPGRVALGPERLAVRPGQFTCINPQDLQRVRLIGSGGFGEVYKEYHRVWMIHVAVKYMRVDGSDSHNLLEEAKKMHKAQFEYILRLYGIAECILESGTKSLGLVTEFMENGSLENLLHHFNVPWPLRLRFVYEIALGMNFLHNLKPALYHHDLKPANILLNKDYRIKICDFGLAKWRKYTSQTSGDSSKNRGTLSYMAPECFVDINTRKGTKFDVYSYGIVIWEIVTCQKPYENAVNSQHLKLCVANGDRPDLQVIPKDILEFYDPLIKLMKQCWHENPDERPPFSKCIRDLEPQQWSEQETRQAMQSLVQQESTCVDEDRELSNGGSMKGSSDRCELVEEQNEYINLAEAVQESIQMECMSAPLSVVTPHECMELSRLVTEDWKALARYLGLTKGEIDTIDYDYQVDGLTEKVYQILYTWRQRQGQNATRALFMQALRKIGKENLCKDIWR